MNSEDLKNLPATTRFNKAFGFADEERKKPTDKELAEKAAQMSHPGFHTEENRWILIGPGTVQLNALLIKNPSHLNEFNAGFEKTMHDYDKRLKLWGERVQKAERLNPNEWFEKKWNPMYEKYCNGEPVEFAIRMTRTPGYDHSKDQVIQILRPKSS